MDETINTAVSCFHRRREGVNGSAIGEIDVMYREPLPRPGECGRVRQGVGRQIYAGDSRALGQEPEGDIPADTVPSAGDDEDVSLDLHETSPLLGCVVGVREIAGSDEPEDDRRAQRGTRTGVGVAHHRRRAVPRGVQPLYRGAVFAQDPGTLVSDDPALRAKIADDEFDGVEG